MITLQSDRQLRIYSLILLTNFTINKINIQYRIEKILSLYIILMKQFLYIIPNILFVVYLRLLGGALLHGNTKFQVQPVKIKLQEEKDAIQLAKEIL